MSSFAMLAAFAVAAFLVAWAANALVGLLSGERPQDTGSLWLDTFLRFFTVLELGLIGRLLNYLGLTGWPRKAVFFVGMVCVLVFLVKACHDARTDYSSRYIRSYGITNGQLYELKNR
jgi:hypothetical protein